MKNSLSLSAYLTKLLVLLFALYLFLSHLISFVTQSPALAIKLALPFIVITCFFFRKKIQLPAFSRWDLVILLFSLALATLMAIRDSLWGNPDNFHIPLTASIAMNDIYPPILPSTFDTAMTNYHYGTDLIGAMFVVLFGVDAITAQTLQVGFDVFLCILSLNLLVETFLVNRFQSCLVTVFIALYTSINGLDFFIREAENIFHVPIKQFLASWLLISWTSVAHMTALLRLTCQNSVLFFALLSITILVSTIKYKEKDYFIPLTLTGFAVYFTFPAYFYSMLTCFGFVLIWELYQSMKTKTKTKTLISESVLTSFYMLLALYIGKVLTFTGDFGNSSGMKGLIVSPSLEWVHWGKAYLNYFYSPSYLQGLKYAVDHVHAGYQPIIPFFSSITFREFGLEALLALIILVYQFNKKKLNYSIILALSAYSSMMLPLLVRFLPREIETIRFLHWSKFILVIFVCVNIPYFIDLFMKRFNKPLLRRTLKFLMITIMIILLVPGMVSVLPIRDFFIVGNQSVSPENKKLVSILSKIHKTGDVCVDTVDFIHGHNISELAGFYGIGGQIFRADRYSRETAISTLNPALLQELKVDYLLLNDSNKLTSKAMDRIKDPQLFQELTEVRNQLGSYRMFKFLAKNTELSSEILSQLRSEYFWMIGCDIGKDYIPIKDTQGQIYAAVTKAEAATMKESIRSNIASQNFICAYWLREQALAR